MLRPHLHVGSRLLLAAFVLCTSAFAQAPWTASDGAPHDWFGFSVAQAGSWSASGAPFHDGGGSEAGAVYLVDSLQGAEQKLQADPVIAGARFGSSVAMDGSILVVGAPGDGPGGGAIGCAYVFERIGGTWNQLARLNGLPGHAGDGFGTSVAIRGNRILIGAPWNNVNGGQAGAAFAFDRRNDDWLLVDVLRSPATGPGDAFGYALDLGDQWACIGAYSANPFVFNEGSVTAYEFSNASYVLHSTLLDDSPTPNSTFGRSVSVFGNQVAVGATRDHSSMSESGRVSMFAFDGGQWAFTQSLTPVGSTPGNAFGFSVSLEDQRLLVGAPTAFGPQAQSGSAFLFEPFVGGWEQTIEISIRSAQNGDFVGVGVSLSPQGALIGGMRDSTQGWQAGAVYLADIASVQTPTVVSICGCEVETPCGTQGSSYGCPNSVGSGAVAGIEGRPSVSADDMVLTLEHISPGQFGFFWMGDSSTNVALYDGYRCVTGLTIGLFRLGLGVSDSSGTLRTGPGIVAGTSFIPGSILAGSQWCFQGVYRDSGGPCGRGVNLSDAIWVTFQD